MAAWLRAVVRSRIPLTSLWSRKTLPAVAYSTDKIPTDQEQATGLEKKELDALLAGVDDPFNMKIEKAPGGTKDKPQLVPSMYSERIVGCICDEDSVTINYMVVKKGPPQRCDCGFWLQLTEGSSVKVDI